MNNTNYLMLLFCLAISVANGQDYSLKDIMQGNDFIGHQPENQRWTADGTFILYDLKTQADQEVKTYFYNLKTGLSDTITPSFELLHPVLEQSKNCHFSLFVNHQTLYRYSHKKKLTTPLFTSTHNIKVLQYDHDCRAYFIVDQQIFRYDSDNGAIQQILTIQKEDTKLNNQVSPLANAEQELFQYIRDQEEQSIKIKKNNKQNKIPVAQYKSPALSQIQLSLDANYLTFRMDYPTDEKETEVQKHITSSGHTELIKARSKVGNHDPEHRLAIYSFKKDSLYLVDFSTLTDIRKKPEYFKEYGDTVKQYLNDRAIIMHRIIQDDLGKYTICDVRSYDNKDRWIVEIDLPSGKIKELEHQHDEAWIGGPGISSWNMVEGTLGFLPNSSTIYFQSEESGYAHLYLLDVTTGIRKQVTNGNWEIYETQFSIDGGTAYLTTNKLHPGTRCLYQLNLKDGSLKPILEGLSAYLAILSPDEKYFAVLHSNSNEPWDLYLAPNKEKAEMKRITNTPSKEFRKTNWIKPELISFESDGDMVYARLYRPQTTSNNAAVMFVHGAGYLQNAHHFWSQYHREYLFHDYLSRIGYTILDIDYRASEGYGRDHRTAIYRHMGPKEVNDYIAGRQLLIDSLQIDSSRIGIYGGSYGGFITLMALFTHPGKFACGAALRSVTDWQHYNHEYTSNILNYPATDSVAYRRSSPIYFADNLRDPLLILHGMIDDNVQLQDVVRLSQRLIELEKDNWNMAFYPIEAHGFKATSSWLDEYKRIEALFYENLIKK